MMLARGKSRRGFTLIELLVVVAIIALLMGILLPSLAGARQEAQAVKCLAGERQMGLALTIFTVSNNGYMPEKGGDGTNSANQYVGYWNDSNLWFNAITLQTNANPQSYWDLYMKSKYYPLNRGNGGVLPTVGMNHIYVCPTAGVPQGVTTGAVGGPPDTVQDNYFLQWGLDPRGSPLAMPTFICYNYNSKMASDPNATELENNSKMLKLTQLQAQPNLIVISEKRMRQDELTADDKLNPVYAATGDMNYNNYYRTLSQFKGMWSRFTTRHKNKGNVIFIDGHGERISYAEMNTPSVMPDNSNKGDWNRPGRWVWNPIYSAN